MSRALPRRRDQAPFVASSSTRDASSTALPPCNAPSRRARHAPHAHARASIVPCSTSPGRNRAPSRSPYSPGVAHQWAVRAVQQPHGPSQASSMFSHSFTTKGASAFVSVAPFTAAGERGLARPIAHSTARSAHEKPKRRCLGQRSPSGGRSLTPRDPRPSARPARARGHKLRPGARVRRGVQGWVPTRRAARPRERCAQKNGDVRLPPTLAGNAGALAPLLLTDTCTQHAHRCPCAWRDPQRLGAAGARGGRQQSADCTPRRVRACSFTRNGASWRRSPPPSRRRAAPLPPSGRPWRTHVPAGVLWRRVRRLGRRRRREAVVVVVLEQREARAVGELGLRIGAQTASEAASVSEAASERSPGEGAGVCTKPTTSKRTN